MELAGLATLPKTFRIAYKQVCFGRVPRSVPVRWTRSTLDTAFDQGGLHVGEPGVINSKFDFHLEPTELYVTFCVLHMKGDTTKIFAVRMLAMPSGVKSSI